MAKGLSRQELAQALEKIRNRYQQLAERYRMPGMFNVERFNRRYMETLRNGWPLDRFLADEIAVLQELEQRAIEKTTPPDRSASRMADQLLESFSQAISGYPVFDFCNRADDETRRLAGMLRKLDEKYGHLVPGVRSLIPGSLAKELLQDAENRIFQLLGADRNGFSRYLSDVQLHLDRPATDERGAEQIKKEFFKEAGFLLYQLERFFTVLLEEQQCRDEAACRNCLHYVAKARQDFRLTAFQPGCPG